MTAFPERLLHQQDACGRGSMMAISGDTRRRGRRGGQDDNVSTQTAVHVDRPAPHGDRGGRQSGYAQSEELPLRKEMVVVWTE